MPHLAQCGRRRKLSGGKGHGISMPIAYYGCFQTCPVLKEQALEPGEIFKTYL